MTFCSCRKTALLEKTANFKIHDITACLTNNCHTYMLSNISRRKGNQTMKFGRLIECNMRNTFLEKTYTKCSWETILRPFPKKSKLSISLYKQCNVSYSWLLLYAKLRAITIYWNYAANSLPLPQIKPFLRNKRRSGTTISCKIFETNSSFHVK